MGRLHQPKGTKPVRPAKSDVSENPGGFHKHLEPRLLAIYDTLMAGHRAGKSLSSSSKGNEREVFIREFLSRIFPPIYRFDSGDITDIYEEKSGQVDIVAEYPLMCSFPQHEKAPRLFLAETVAVAIEVKSNLQSQWKEVLQTARQIKKLRRQFKRDAKLADAAYYASVAANQEPQHGQQLLEVSRAIRSEAEVLPFGPGESIAVYVVGFCGWKNAQALEKKLISAMDGDIRLVDGVFQLDIQAWRCCHRAQLSQTSDGPRAMLTFIDGLEWYLNQKVVPQRLAWSYLRLSYTEHPKNGLNLRTRRLA